MKRIILTLAILSLLLLNGCITTTRNGTHNGYITAVEQTGVFWPTWTIYQKTDPTSTQEDKYCVEDKKLIPELIKASDTKERVTLHYHSELLVAPWRCDDDDIVESMEHQ